MLRNFTIACATFAGAANAVKLAEEEITIIPAPTRAIPNRGNWPIIEDYPEYGTYGQDRCFSSNASYGARDTVWKRYQRLLGFGKIKGFVGLEQYQMSLFKAASDNGGPRYLEDGWPEASTEDGRMDLIVDWLRQFDQPNAATIRRFMAPLSLDPNNFVKNPEVSIQTYNEAYRLLCQMSKSYWFVISMGIAEERVAFDHTTLQDVVHKQSDQYPLGRTWYYDNEPADSRRDQPTTRWARLGWDEQVDRIRDVVDFHIWEMTQLVDLYFRNHPELYGTDGLVPDAKLPDAEVPDAEVPDAEVPDAEVPDAEVPDAEVPVAEVLDFSGPDSAPTNLPKWIALGNLNN